MGQFGTTIGAGAGWPGRFQHARSPRAAASPPSAANSQRPGQEHEHGLQPCDRPPVAHCEPLAPATCPRPCPVPPPCNSQSRGKRSTWEAAVCDSSRVLGGRAGPWSW